MMDDVKNLTSVVAFFIGAGVSFATMAFRGGARNQQITDLQSDMKLVQQEVKKIDIESSEIDRRVVAVETEMKAFHRRADEIKDGINRLEAIILKTYKK